MKVILVIISLLSILISCEKHDQNTFDKLDSIKNDTIMDKPITKNKEKLTYNKICKCGKGSLTVNTEYYITHDTLNEKSYIIINQDLVFAIDQKVVKSIKPPYKHLKRIINDQLINVPITDVYSVKCIEKDNQYAYKLYGANIYDPPHEFFSLNDLEGNWLWYFYGDRYDIYKSFGDEQVYIKKFGKQLNDLNDMIIVVPDDF